MINLYICKSSAEILTEGELTLWFEDSTVTQEIYSPLIGWSMINSHITQTV